MKKSPKFRFFNTPCKRVLFVSMYKLHNRGTHPREFLPQRGSFLDKNRIFATFRFNIQAFPESGKCFVIQVLEMSANVIADETTIWEFNNFLKKINHFAKDYVEELDKRCL